MLLRQNGLGDDNVADAVMSGRITDTVKNLLDWLAKAELYLAEDQPILGDLDTVNVVIEKHKVTTVVLTDIFISYTTIVRFIHIQCVHKKTPLLFSCITPRKSQRI